jgi:hypothetical protein
VHWGFLSSQLSAPCLLKLSLLFSYDPLKVWKWPVERKVSLQAIGYSGWGNSMVTLKAGDATSWPAWRLQRGQSIWPLQSDLYTLFMVPVDQEWTSTLASSAPVLFLVLLTWLAVMTNNPSCIEPGNSLSPNLLLLLLLFQVNQDESGLSLLVLNSNSSGIPFSAYIPHDRHQKVLFSNLSLTVFFRHLVKHIL